MVDSSRILLSPGSVISYDVPFVNNKRDIFLEGEAVFKVAHDKTKPFTVFAGGLATTALGTEFKISTHINHKRTIVKLFNGKVVIKSTHADLKGWRKKIYLQPGQQMEYNADKMAVAVTAIDKAVLAKLSVSKELHKKVPVTDNNLVFSSTSLPGVMEKLAAYYNMKIVFDSTQISAMNFTGTITKKDSLPVVLKVIGQMNNLDITQQGDEFIVKKLDE